MKELKFQEVINSEQERENEELKEENKVLKANMKKKEKDY